MKSVIDTTNLIKLFDEEGLSCFHAQRIATKLRIQRCHLVREHLRHLKNDFKLICMALKVIIVESRHDRPDLAWALVRNQITFTHRMMIFRIHLVCFRYGLGSWMSPQ